MIDEDFDFDFAEDFGNDDDFPAFNATKASPSLSARNDVSEAPLVKVSKSPPCPQDNIHDVSQDGNITTAKKEQHGQLNSSGAFDDSDDELLSQIDDNAVVKKSQNKKLSSQEKLTNSASVHAKSAVKLASAFRSPRTEFSVTNDDVDVIIFDNEMKPPKSGFVPKASLIVPTTQSSMGFKSQESDAGSISSSLASSSTSSVSTNSSREAFFANWESDELSSYEKKLQTIKRRFPGPAGLLPKISQSEIKLLDISEHPLTQQITKIIASDLTNIQQNESKSMEMPAREIFRITKAPWRELLKVLNINPKMPDGILHYMNIRWVRYKVSRHPVSTKIPFLAMVVQEEPEIMSSKRKLIGRPKNPSIKLMDPSGSICAAMDSAFVEAYGSELSPGTAIAVKNAGFIRIKRQLILTITEKNIICMTTMVKTDPSPSEKQVKYCTQLGLSKPTNRNTPSISETHAGVRVIKFCDFFPSEAMAEYHLILNANLNEENEHETNQAPLFSAIRKTPSQQSLPNGISDRPFSTGFNPPFQQIQKDVNSAPPCPKPDFSVDLSAFGDDDDDELMQALDDVDFLWNT